jgi:hypothetical protein
MNQVLLKPQQLSGKQFIDIVTKPPGGKGSFKKLYFQCELREYKDQDPVFGLVAYGGYDNSTKKIGPPVRLTDIYGRNPEPFSNLDLIFGNMELILDDAKIKADFQPVSEKKEKSYHFNELLKILKSLKPEELEKFNVYFTPMISENPHVYYDGTNPSPPAEP